MVAQEPFEVACDWLELLLLVTVPLVDFCELLLDPPSVLLAVLLESELVAIWLPTSALPTPTEAKTAPATSAVLTRRVRAVARLRAEFMSLQ